MTALLNGDLSASMSPNNSISNLVTPHTGSSILNNPTFTFCDDNSSDSSGDDVDLEEKQPITQTLSPKISNFPHAKHSPLLKQLLSTNGELFKSISESNKTTAETRPLFGTTLYIAKCNIDVSSVLVIHKKIERKKRSLYFSFNPNNF
jgi:hypothetical protein